MTAASNLLTKQLLGEGDTTRTAVGNPRVGMALSEGDQASGDIHAAPGSTVGSEVYLKCLYTNARSVRNKRDELETSASSHSYDIIGFVETWWNESHYGSAGLEGLRAFSRDGQGR